MINRYQVSFFEHAFEDRFLPDQCMPVLAHFSTEKEASAYIDQLPEYEVHDLSVALLVGDSVQIELEAS